MKVLVIGYGSPIRGDDALGPLVADRLIDEIESDEVTVYSRHILTAELVAELAEASLVIFLDTCVEGTPGCVLCQPLIADPCAGVAMAHFLDPREMLAWVAALYGRAPEAYLVSAAGATFEYAGYQLSETAAAAVEPMCAQVRELIARHARQTSGTRQA